MYCNAINAMEKPEINIQRPHHKQITEAITYVCMVKKFNARGVCNQELHALGELGRHLREVHGISPSSQAKERYSIAKGYCPPTFK